MFRLQAAVVGVLVALAAPAAAVTTDATTSITPARVAGCTTDGTDACAAAYGAIRDAFGMRPYCDINDTGNTCGAVVEAVNNFIENCQPNDPGTICGRVLELAQELIDTCEINDPNSICGRLVDAPGEFVQECLNDSGSVCQTALRLANDLVTLALQLAGQARVIADSAVALAMLIVNDQIAQIREIGGPYVELAESLAGTVVKILTDAVSAAPAKHSSATMTRDTTAYSLAVGWACGAASTTVLSGGLSMTISVAGAAVSPAAPRSTALTVTRFTRLECLVRRDTPTGPVTLASFEQRLANPASVVTGTKTVPAGSFYVCGRGDITLTNNEVVPFSNC